MPSNTAMNKVAVLIAVYAGDKPEFFREALQSLKDQTYAQTHIILLIDGAIGEALQEVIEEFRAEISQVIATDQNMGLARALNTGLKYCFRMKYTFIARMDADDIALPDRIEKQIRFLEKNPETDVVGGAIDEIDAYAASRGKIILYPETHGACFRFFAKRDPLAHPAVMFRKSFFDKAGLYSGNHRKNQDTWLWYKGFKTGCRFANIPDVVLKFRITGEFFKSRRAGIQRAQKIFTDRLEINRELGYGIKANVFALAGFLLTISPPFVKKFAYKKLR